MRRRSWLLFLLFVMFIGLAGCDWFSQQTTTTAIATATTTEAESTTNTTTTIGITTTSATTTGISTTSTTTTGISTTSTTNMTTTQTTTVATTTTYLGDLIYASLDEFRLEVVGYIGNPTNIVIPTTYDGKSVVGIAAGAFDGASSLVHLGVPASIEYIQGTAFTGCINLQTIVFGASTPANLYSYDAFSPLISLSQIIVPSLSIDLYKTAEIWENYADIIIPVDSFTVNFLGGGGVLVEGNESQTIYYGDEAIPPVYERQGYVFTGWDFAFNDITINLTITAQWEIIIFTVNFNGDGGTLSEGSESQQVPYGGSATPPVYIKAGFVFIGWSQAYDNVTSNITVTALWYIDIPGTEGLIYELNEDETFAVIGYIGDSSTVQIPYFHDGIKVTSINDEAFYNCEIMTDILLPPSITRIGTYAFYSCENLLEITIPDSVLTIERRAFAHCYNLASVTLSENLSVIEEGVFSLCRSLAEIYIPASITTIGSNAFSYCAFITLIIPDTVLEIKNGAFSNCTNLSSIVLSSNITYIADSLFVDCSSLTSVSIPNNVTSIGFYSFAFTTISEIYIHSNINSINLNAFYDNFSLLEINVSEDNIIYKSIDGVLFNKESTTLIKFPAAKTGPVVFPADTTRIEDMAFENCIYLVNISIPEGIISIGSYGFANTIALETISLPDSLQLIGDDAFYYCESLKTITIPDNVTNIGSHAFSHCSLLEYITLSANLEAISDSMFGHCTSLKEIDIPESVTSIGYLAFYNCSSLVEISIPEGVTTIGNSAFSFCRNLVYIEIPASVTNMGDMICRESLNLLIVILHGSIPPIFSGSPLFESLVHIFVPSLSLEDYKSAPIWSDYESKIYAYGTAYVVRFLGDEGVLVSGDAIQVVYEGEGAVAPVFEREGYIFAGWDLVFDNITSNLDVTAQWISVITDEIGIQYLLKPDDSYEVVGFIGDSSSVEIPSAYTVYLVTSIGVGAFRDNLDLEIISLPYTISSIGDEAFSGCTNLVKVYLEAETPPTIGTNVFDGTAGSLTIYVPDTSFETYEVATGWNDLASSLDSLYMEYTVTFDGNGGILESGTEIQIIVYKAAAIPPVYSRAGYEFVGWDKEFDDIRENMTVTAQWDLISVDTYTVTFIGNGGTLISGDEFQTVESGQSAIAPIYEREGYLFVDWDVPFDNVTSDLVVEAQWILIETFTVTFNGNGGTIVSGTEIQIVNYGEDAIAPIYEREGYLFDGWSVSFDNVTSDLDVFAQWSVIVVGTAGLVFELKEDDTYEVTNYLGSSTEVVIPNAYLGKAVTSIGENAFVMGYDVTSISIPETVTLIKQDAFTSCTNLTTITIPNSVSHVIGAFRGSSLNEIILLSGSQLAIVDDVLFSADMTICFGFLPTKATTTSYIIPTGVTIIEDYAFDDLEDLLSVVIPDSVLTIGSYSFSNCENLTTVSMGSAVTSIGEYAFYFCKKLTAVTIPDGVTTIEQWTFASCWALASVTFSSNLISIGNRAFQLSGIESLTLGDALISIGEYAFYSCQDLVSVNLGNNLESIGEKAFNYCTELLSIVIPDSVLMVGAETFGYCYVLDIYVEAISLPIDWSDTWNPYNCPVVWGYVA